MALLTREIAVEYTVPRRPLCVVISDGGTLQWPVHGSRRFFARLERPVRWRELGAIRGFRVHWLFLVAKPIDCGSRFWELVRRLHVAGFGRRPLGLFERRPDAHRLVPIPGE